MGFPHGTSLGSPQTRISPHLIFGPSFLSCPCLQQAVRQKNTFDKKISNAQRTPIIAHQKKCYQASTLLSQHIVTIVTNVIAPTRTTVDSRTAPPNAPPSLIHTKYIKTSERVMLSDVASSLSQRPPRNATKQLHSLEQRATPQLQETHETDMLPGDRYHCHSISSHSATNQLRSLERQRHAATSAYPMIVTHPPIYKRKLSNVASSLSQRPSRSVTKQTAPSRTTSDTTAARTFPHYKFRLKARCIRT